MTAEVLVGGGVDTNLFLQIAANPQSALWHEARGPYFGRVTPAVVGTLSTDWLRLSLQYDADLRMAQGSGLLALQEGILTLAAPELGRASAYAAARVGRYDNTTHTNDRFVTLGGEAGVAVRAARLLRVSGRYRVDRRDFQDLEDVVLDYDRAHTAEVRLAMALSQVLALGIQLDYLTLRTTFADPDSDPAGLDRLLLQVDTTWAASARTTLLAGAWVGLQRYAGLQSDRQAGAMAMFLYRISDTLSGLLRYDGMLSRATDEESAGYDRNVVLVGLLAQVGTVAPRRAVLAEEPESSQDDGEAPVATAKGRVRFRLRAPGATAVRVVGSWNDWEERTDQELIKTHDPALWEVSVRTGPGPHRYRFIVDGQAIRPPDAPGYRPDGFGGEDGAFDAP